MSLLPTDDETALTAFFSGTILSFERSTMGAMLEMQAARYRDSEGRRVLPPEDRWDRWTYMALHETRSEPSYEPDLDSILELARVSRRLMEVAQKCPVARDALEVFYGPPGLFWKGTFRRQEWSLVGLTRTGQEWFQERRTRAELCGMPVPSSAALEVATEADLQELAPNAERYARLQSIAEEINRLLGLIVCTWQQTNGRSHAEK